MRKDWVAPATLLGSPETFGPSADGRLGVCPKLVYIAASKRDEIVAQQVVVLLHATSKYQMGGGRFRVPFRVQEADQKLAASGRFAGQAEAPLPELEAMGVLKRAGYAGRRDFVRKRRKRAAPVDLPAVAQQGLEGSREGELVVPLPVDVLALHSTQRGGARNVLREKTKTWLESDAGKAWQQERLALFSPEGANADEPQRASDSSSTSSTSSSSSVLGRKATPKAKSKAKAKAMGKTKGKAAPVDATPTKQT